MRKIIAKIMLFVMIVNAMLANVSSIIFAAAKPKAASKTNFVWNKEATLNENLEIIQRPSSSDEVFLSWDIESIGGSPNSNGTYTLTYPIADNKEIEFKVTRKNNKSQVTYKVNGDNEVRNNGNNSDKKLLIYKDGAYLLANDKNFPDNETFKLDDKYSSGDTRNVSFEIGQNGGASFQYGGNTIKFLWRDGKMYFVTNAVVRGNIYPFELEYTHNTATESEEKKIFLGIDTVNGFVVKPFANATNSNNGKDLIDQTSRPITEYPGGDIVGVSIKFNTPKEWQSATPPTTGGKFDFVSPTTNKDTEVVFNLGHSEVDKRLQVRIANIYANNGVTITGNQSISAEYKYDTNTHQGELILKNLEASTIYSDISISAERQADPFETLEATLLIGTVYTYPKYRMIALGASEFYLEIEPYEGYDGFYVVYQGNQQSSLSKWSTYEEKNQGKDKILISVPLDATNPQEKFFRVDFSFTPPDLNPGNQQPFTSQILKFKPAEEDIVLSSPKNLEIVSANIVKKDNEPENLFLTLKWDIDYESVLAGLMKQHNPANNSNFNIDYLFYKGDTPTSFETNDFIGVNLEFINKTIGSIKDGIKYSLPTKYNNVGIELVTDQDKTFTSERTEVSGNKSNKILEANVTFKIPVSSKNDNNIKVLQYPNTYFLANKGEYVIESATGQKENYETGLSLPVTLTLNGIEDIEVPAPQNLQVLQDTITQDKFSINFDTLKYKDEADLLYNYNEIMLKTIGRELQDDSIKYDFYITQDKALFDELVKYSKDEEIPDNIKQKINKYNNTQAMSNDGINIDLKTASGQNGVLLDTLRQKGIVQIADISQNISISKQRINFEGLDENETYYIVARTNVTPYENSNLLTDKLDYSKFSKMITATTIKPETPDESEKVPPAPNKFIADNITLNSANLIWNRVNDSVQDGQDAKSTLEYQFIKTKGEALPDSFLKSKDSYEKTWQNLSNIKNKEGLITIENKLYEFDSTNNTFSTTEASKDRYEYINWQGSEGNILDKTLSPNQVYFYYIRTVRIVDGEDKAYSVWVPLSFTTKNTTGPTNLRVETKAEYNKKSEVVISFDIPKMDLNLIGTEYDLQYSLKEDLGEWSQDITMDKSKLTFKENEDGKTIKVTYKITGLKSGTMYTIRVRMLNKPLNAPSIYSNEVEHRTDSDNNDNDYDEDVNNWDKNFKDQIEDLKNQSYWFGKDNTSNTVVYYRPQYFDKIINSTNNSIIDLAVGKGGSYKEYYLPASTIIRAFDANKGFKISYNGAEVIFSAKTINPYDNDVIKKIAEEISSKSANVKDYFIKLSVDFRNNKYIIDGSNSLSPSAQISVSVVGTKSLIVDWDSEMLSYIDELLNTKEFSTDVKKEIEQLIKDKTDNKIMVQEIAKIVDSFKSKFGDELNKDLNSLSRKTLPIQYLNGDIIFAYTISAGVSAGGYKKSQGNWISVGVKDYLGKKAIYIRETGEYIFAGKNLVINGVGNLPNGSQIINIVVKYGLDDFLGKDGNINLKSPMTRQQVIGSLARLAGASKTQDSVEFFKTKGIVLSTRNMDNNIIAEEAVYITMKVYEMRSGTKLETVKIRNYKLTQDIKNINTNYKKSIQVAFETGIYNNTNMNAKGTITVQEFLQTLVNMSTMLGI